MANQDDASQDHADRDNTEPVKTVEWRGVLSSVQKTGAWTVPGHLVLHRRLGSVELDFTQAVFTTDTVTIDLDMVLGSVELRVPENVAVESSISATIGSDQDHRRAGNPPHPTARIVVRGRVVLGSLETRDA